MKGDRMARILVIDDNAAFRALVRAILEAAHYAVVEAPDGREGVRLYQTTAIDLVLTDLFMPEVDGFETMQALRVLTPTLPIVAITGWHGGQPWLTAALALGADRVLPKPLRAEDLLTVVQALLAGAAS